MSRTVHPIEAESYRILRQRVDTGGLPPLTRAVVERVIHTTADVAYRGELVCAEAELVAAAAALAAGAPIVTDARMVAAGITTRAARCYLDHPEVAERAAATGRTRSAAAVAIAAAEVGPGAVWVVGNAPTALVELVALPVRPALVVGVPVGFVGSVAAKAALRASGLPAVSTRSERGGSTVAAAVVNALLYWEPEER